MTWRDPVYLVAAVLLAVALGTAAATFSEKPVVHKSAHLLWAIAIIFLTAALAYVIAAQTLNWF
jgi:hypothetical protein